MTSWRLRGQESRPVFCAKDVEIEVKPQILKKNT